MIRGAALAGLLAFSLAGRAAAQEAGAAVDPGDRVRLTVPEATGRPVVGRVLAIFPDTLLVEVAPGSVGEVPLARIRTLEVSRGRDRGRGFWRGAAVGLGLSAALEMIALVHDQRNPGEAVGMSLVIPVMVAPVVMLTGGLVGAARGPDRWERVEVPARQR